MNAEPNVNEALQQKPVAQMREQLPNFARECDRYGLSDRSGAAVASGLLQDLGIVTQASSSKVIDRSKLRRSRTKYRNSLMFIIINYIIVLRLQLQQASLPCRLNASTFGYNFFTVL